MIQLLKNRMSSISSNLYEGNKPITFQVFYFNKMSLNQHTGKTRPRTLRGPRTQDPMRTQDSMRTQDLRRTQDPMRTQAAAKNTIKLMLKKGYHGYVINIMVKTVI